MRGRFPPLVAARQSLPKDCAPITVRFPRRITTELHVFFCPLLPSPTRYFTVVIIIIICFTRDSRANVIFLANSARSLKLSPFGNNNNAHNPPRRFVRACTRKKMSLTETLLRVTTQTLNFSLGDKKNFFNQRELLFSPIYQLSSH